MTRSRGRAEFMGGEFGGKGEKGVEWELRNSKVKLMWWWWVRELS